jgi:epoxide hydrolase-like predicted phosphatase
MLTKLAYLLCFFVLIISYSCGLQSTQKNQIKVFVFDFGSVIAKTDHQEIAHFIAQSLDLSDSEALEALKQLKECNLQGKKEQEFWIDYAKAKDIQLPENWIEKLNEAQLHALKEIPGMVALVNDLQRQGYQTALLSNVRKTHADIKRKLGFYDLFHPLLLSYEIGARKPDPEAYTILLNTLKVPPQTIIFIDNKPENIKAARSFGLDGILFISKDQLIQELKKRGIEISEGTRPNRK